MNKNSYKEKEIVTGEYQVILSEYLPSLNGSYTFALAPLELIKKNSVPTQIISLSSSGNLLYQQSFIGNDFKMSAVHFKKIDMNTYSYFLAYVGQGPSCPAEVRFLDLKFREKKLLKNFNDDKDLDCHSIAKDSNGNYYFIYYRKTKSENIFNAEIQGMNSKGDVFFSWRVLDHIKVGLTNSDQIDPIHLNSIDFTPNKKIVANLCRLSTVLIIEPNGGKIISNISRQDWKFVNDPRDGFSNQHSVHILDGNRLLLFDNGALNAPARAVEYELNFSQKTATLKWEYIANFLNNKRGMQGSVQRLSNGNTLIAWGVPALGSVHESKHNSIFSEVNEEGKLVRELWSKENLVTDQVMFVED